MRGVIAVIMKMKKLTAVLMSVTFLCTSFSFGAKAASTDAFYAKDDILMIAGNNHAFYQRNEVPVDVINDSVAPYKEGENFYIPLEFIAHCMNVKMTEDIDNAGKYTVNGNDVTAVMKDDVPYITAEKAAKLTGKKLLTRNNCIILSDSGYNSTYDNIYSKLETDFENTYHVTPDESKGRILANVSGSLWGASSSSGQNDIGELTSGIDTIDGRENQFFYKITAKQATANPNDLNLRFFNESYVNIRDVGLITFYARRSADSQNGKIAVTLQDKAYNTVFSQELILGNEWKKYQLTFKSNKNISKDDRRLFIALGYAQQTIEISGFKTVVFPDTVYAEYELPQTKLNYIGRENDTWLDNELCKIEENRKKDTVIKILDEAGNPVNDADVEMTFDNHLFNIGTEVSQFYITNPGWSTTTAWDVLPEAENIANFHSTLKEYFNTAIPGNAYKWASWNGRKTDSDRCAELIKNMGLRMRGHVLWWDMSSFYSNDANERQILLSMSKEEQNQTVKDHIAHMLTRYKGKAAEWDVLNEPCQSRWVLLKNTEYGKETVIKDWFDTARMTDPDVVLYVNEKDIVGKANDNLETLRTIVSGMINNGVDFDAVGVQAHMGSMPESPQKVAEEIEEITNLGKKASITEYDMSTRNEWLQAQYLRKMVIAAYANPDMLGFNMWGHWDVDHEKRTSPMFRDDWTPKTGVYIWKGLFDYAFSSNIKGKTNTDGTIGARLYEGIYNVTVTRNGVSQSYKVTVDEDGEHTLDIDLSSTRFISDIKLMAGDGEVESLEKWDGAEPLNIDYTINEGYYESSRKNIYITAYGANGTLLGVRNITAYRTGGHTQLPLQLSDKTKKIKFFVWDNGMIPANPMKEF